MTGPGAYRDGVLSHGFATEQQRLRTLEAVCDPVTISVFEQLGVAENWSCLEVGAGNGSMAEWLAQRCHAGEVTATDTVTRFLTSRGNLQVIEHDVAVDEFPERSFDLIHVRNVLMHVPEREKVVPKLIR